MNGVYTNSAVVNNGDYNSIGVNQGFYLGTVTIGALTNIGQLEDSKGGSVSQTGGKRFLYNYWNRIKKPILCTDFTTSWTLSSASLRIANNASAGSNCVEILLGIVEDPIELLLVAPGQVTSNNTDASAGFGEDTTASLDSLCHGLYAGVQSTTGTAAAALTLYAITRLVKYPTMGYHRYNWLERCNTAANTVLFWGHRSPGAGTVEARGGINGMIHS